MTSSSAFLWYTKGVFSIRSYIRKSFFIFFEEILPEIPELPSGVWGAANVNSTAIFICSTSANIHKNNILKLSVKCLWRQPTGKIRELLTIDLPIWQISKHTSRCVHTWKQRVYYTSAENDVLHVSTVLIKKENQKRETTITCNPVKVIHYISVHIPWHFTGF